MVAFYLTDSHGVTERGSVTSSDLDSLFDQVIERLTACSSLNGSALSHASSLCYCHRPPKVSCLSSSNHSLASLDSLAYVLSNSNFTGHLIINTLDQQCEQQYIMHLTGHAAIATYICSLGLLVSLTHSRCSHSSQRLHWIALASALTGTEHVLQLLSSGVVIFSTASAFYCSGKSLSQ